MNGWSDSVLFKLVKNWQFSGNLSLKWTCFQSKDDALQTFTHSRSNKTPTKQSLFTNESLPKLDASRSNSKAARWNPVEKTVWLRIQNDMPTFNLFWRYHPSGDNLPFSNRMNGWCDSVLFKLVKTWQFNGNLSLKMNVLSIKRWRFTDVYPLPKQQNTNKTSLFTNESLPKLDAGRSNSKTARRNPVEKTVWIRTQNVISKWYTFHQNLIEFFYSNFARQASTYLYQIEWTVGLIPFYLSSSKTSSLVATLH